MWLVVIINTCVCASLVLRMPSCARLSWLYWYMPLFYMWCHSRDFPSPSTRTCWREPGNVYFLLFKCNELDGKWAPTVGTACACLMGVGLGCTRSVARLPMDGILYERHALCMSSLSRRLYVCLYVYSVSMQVPSLLGCVQEFLSALKEQAARSVWAEGALVVCVGGWGLGGAGSLFEDVTAS